jgi:uncharacterized protein (TIGR02611 family)
LLRIDPARSGDGAARLDPDRFEIPVERAVTDNATGVARGADEPGDGGAAPADVPRERGRLHRRLHSHPVLSLATKVVVTVVGGLVMLAGVVMLFTPGQGILAIVLGLAILATEYAWAERWLRKAKEKAADARRRAEAMDPAVRRRRLLLAGVVVLVLVGAAVAYLLTYDWPGVLVDGWDWVQSLAGWVPELPGM